MTWSCSVYVSENTQDFSSHVRPNWAPSELVAAEMRHEDTKEAKKLPVTDSDYL